MPSKGNDREHLKKSTVSADCSREAVVCGFDKRLRACTMGKVGDKQATAAEFAKLIGDIDQAKQW